MAAFSLKILKKKRNVCNFCRKFVSLYRQIPPASHKNSVPSGTFFGYSYHQKYKFSAIPIYVSTHYFFLDRKFSPFVNLRAGVFSLLNKKNVGTNEKYSLSKDKQGFSLFVSPSVGVKMHITPNIGIMASISDESYLVKAFDTQRNDYKNKLIHDLGINIGVCFQINGW